MAMTIPELKANRTYAEARYYNAARAYIDAWVELSAHDAALAPHTGEHSGFGAQPVILAHPRAFPDISGAMRDPSGRVAERRNELTAALGSE